MQRNVPNSDLCAQATKKGPLPAPFCNINESDCSALGELEGAPGLCLAVFLALDHA
jgi:hypothetical protein